MYSSVARRGTLLAGALLLLATTASADPPASGGMQLDVEPGALVGAYDELVDFFGFGGVESYRDTVFLPSPRGALVRSLVLPGWGQVYNRQPLKVPFIVVGLGGLVGGTVYSNNRTVLFRRAALFLDCTAEPPLTDPSFCADLDRLEAAHARAEQVASRTLTADAAREIRDRFRRQRDVFALLSVLAYGIQALDAYVAAELADFDIGEDLAIGFSDLGPGIAVRWTF